MSFTQSPAAGQAADAEHITAVRSGDTSAYAVLYERHRAAAYHLARQLVASPSEADDLVSDAFVKVFQTLLSGGGPDSAFRAYLLTSVRNTFYDDVRRGKKVTYTDDMEAHDDGAPHVDPAIAQLDSSLAARAFARLPERWQTVLWHTEIDGESPAQVAPVLGMTANATAALAYRAREGLRQAFLQEHVADVGDSACKLTSDRLGAWARGGLSRREQAQVDRHLDECDRCAAVAAEITDLGTGLRGIVAVLAIGSVPLTAAYLAGGTTAKIGALAWAGVGTPVAGFAQLSPLLSTSSAPVAAAAAPAATTTTTSTTGAFVPESTSAAEESAGAAGSGGAATASNSKGLLAAIAGTAAVAAIATAVIVGSSYDDPNPSATDAGLSPSTSSSGAAPSMQPQSPVPSTTPSTEAPPSDSSFNDSPSTYGSDDIADLPAIPPVIGEVIPGLDSTIPALQSETPAPAPAPTENPAPAPAPTQNPWPHAGAHPDAESRWPGDDEPTATSTSSNPARPPRLRPDYDSPPPPPPSPTPADPTTTPESPITATVVGTTVTSVPFTIINGGANGDPTYQKTVLTIQPFGTPTTPAAGTENTTCSVYINESPTPYKDGNQACGDQALEIQLGDISPGPTGVIVKVVVNINSDLSGAIDFIPLSFEYGGAQPAQIKIGNQLGVEPPAPTPPGQGGGPNPGTAPQAGGNPGTGQDGQGQNTP
ncbi:sigma-70 family RNA polymerase sigma factor [Blastococcus sp. Marseille-P5729]|uniref:sigma-70 family RNA polymerase sigma factor n=1 Tax=Blastococcus sp. Marseille-P5729 TaxID=2086582 RepID=UPI000D0EE013|nr:sigma-70 family RNA polymerase sigma factor [Blastococcus sp. Marseille-P5729]